MALAKTEVKPIQINNQVLRSHDIEEVKQKVGTLLWPHRMRILEAENRVNSKIMGHLLGDFAVLDLHYGARVEVRPEAASEFYLVHIPVSGYCQLRHGLHKYHSTPEHIAITSPATLTYVMMDQHSRHLNIRIDRAMLEERVSAMIGYELRSPLVFRVETPSASPAGSALIQALNSLFLQVRTVPEMFQFPQIVDQYKNLLLTILISMFSHSYSETLQRGAHRPVPWHVRQAKEYIEENLAEAICLTQVAEHVGVSARTLQNGFRQFEGISPAEYIRNRRLQRLHQALQHADPNGRITDIMLEHGITSFGRYAHYYQARYHCLPSETLKK